jgi:hypothetical protein
MDSDARIDARMVTRGYRSADSDPQIATRGYWPMDGDPRTAAREYMPSRLWLQVAAWCVGRKMR